MIVPIRNGKLESDLDLNGFNLLNASGVMGFLPSQVGQGGKYLTTNGTIANWGTIDLSAYQLLSSTLTLLAGVDPSANQMIYFNGSSLAELTPITAAGRALLDDADATAQRVTLSLGTAAIVNTGTSGATVPLLNAANTWTAGQTQTFGANATNPGFKFVGVTADPSSLSEGAHWYRTDTHKLRIHDGTAARSLLMDSDLGSGVATFLATPTLANLKTAVTDETTVGWNLLTLANPGAISIPLINADNSVTATSTTGTGNIVRATSPTLTTPQFADLGYIADANGNELLILDTVTSAVNELTLANAATGTNPKFTASGGDTNVGIDFRGKGTGAFKFSTSGNPTGTQSQFYCPQNIMGGADFSAWDGDFGNRYLYITTNRVSQWSGGMFQWTNSATSAFSTVDTALARAAAGVSESNSGTTGTLGAHLASRLVTAKTANYTVLTADKSTLFTNTGASGGINFSLPAAVVGNTYTFSVEAAQTLTCTANGTDTIRLAATVSGAGGTIASATIGNVWTIVCTQTGKWVVISHEGAPTVT